EDALATIKRRTPATDPDDFLRHLHQDRERVNAALQLIDQAEREFQAAKVKARPAMPPPGDPLLEAQARAEVERQREAVLAQARITRLEEELAVSKRQAESLQAQL